jgi:hypothetical protein
VLVGTTNGDEFDIADDATFGTVNTADLLVSLELLTEIADGDGMGATVVVVV